MELNGKIKVINPTTQVSNDFRKRELVLSTDEQYPQQVLIEFVQDKCDVLDKYKVGEYVVISINIRGREWTNKQGETKYFNSIQGWRIEKKTPVNDIEVNQQVTIKDPFQTTTNINEEEKDDLPF